MMHNKFRISQYLGIRMAYLAKIASARAFKQVVFGVSSTYFGSYTILRISFDTNRSEYMRCQTSYQTDLQIFKMCSLFILNNII